MKYIFIFLISLCATGQEISRSTISVIGSSSINESGFTILQSVGQLSTIGFYEIIQQSIIQGYQQPTGYRIIDSSVIGEILKIYPVPLIDKLNFLFSVTQEGTCRVDLFDRLGRLVLSEELKISDYKAIMSLNNLPTSTYIIKVTKPNAVFYETIIKY